MTRGLTESEACNCGALHAALAPLLRWEPCKTSSGGSSSSSSRSIRPSPLLRAQLASFADEAAHRACAELLLCCRGRDTATAVAPERRAEAAWHLLRGLSHFGDDNDDDINDIDDSSTDDEWAFAQLRTLLSSFEVFEFRQGGPPAHRRRHGPCNHEGSPVSSE